MQILFLTQVLPYPLDAGPKVRAYYVLRHLAQTHAVTLVSFVRSTDTAAAIAHLNAYCQAVYTVPMPRSRWIDAIHLIQSLFTNQPFMIVRDQAPAMTHLLRDLIGSNNFDAIHADQLWMAPYALWSRQIAPSRSKPRTVLDQHNAVYLIPERLAASEGNPFKRALLTLEAHKLARFERDICRQFDKVTWVTREDQAALQRQLPNGALTSGPAVVIPICVEPQAEAIIERTSGVRRITFLGGLHWPPNAEGIQWFVRDIWPQVYAQEPAVILTIIGKNPPSDLQEHSIPNLHITGYVDDPMPLLAETAAFIVPLRAGGGMRVKILDAWTWGLPMVSTSIGAEGIDICPDENILIADSAVEFAQALIRLLRQPAEANAMAQSGRRWVEQRYNWRTIYAAWDAIYS